MWEYIPVRNVFAKALPPLGKHFARVCDPFAKQHFFFLYIGKHIAYICKPFAIVAKGLHTYQKPLR
jgi:hypothetical protein